MKPFPLGNVADPKMRGEKKSQLPAALLVLIVSIAVYSNAVFNGFVIDDLSQVVENPWIRDFRHIPEIFTSNLWAYEGRDSNYYRPLMHIVYLLLYQLFGLKQWAFHALNILVHAGVSVLVLLISARLLSEDRKGASPNRLFPALIASLLFATHPIHVEAVAWVGGIMDLSCAFFYLLSVYLFLRSNPASTVGSLWSASCFFIATLFKEPALTLPGVLLTYDFLFRRGGLHSRDGFKRYLPFFVVATVYFAMRVNALGGMAPVQAGKELTPGLYALNTFVLFRRYLEMLILPIGLNVWHVFRPISSLFSVNGVVSVMAAVAFAGIAIVAAKKRPVACFALAFIVLPLLPAFYLPGLTQGIENAFTERYLYLPSVGYVLLVGMLAQWGPTRRPSWNLAMVMVLCVLVGTYSFGTIRRNAAWKDSYSLWSDAVRKSPENAKAHEILGYALLYRGKTEEGISHLRTAMRLKPEFLEIILNKGILYGRKGLTDKAIFTFHIALICRPDSVDAHYNLGIAYDRKGWADQAIEQYHAAILVDPAHADSYSNLGIAYAKKGQIEKAIENLEAAVRLHPKDPSFHRNLAKAYEMKGMAEKAKQHRQEANRLNPD